MRTQVNLIRCGLKFKICFSRPQVCPTGIRPEAGKPYRKIMIENARPRAVFFVGRGTLARRAQTQNTLANERLDFAWHVNLPLAKNPLPCYNLIKIHL